MRPFSVRSLTMYMDDQGDVKCQGTLSYGGKVTYLDRTLTEGKYTRMVPGPRAPLRDLRPKRADLDLVELSNYASTISRGEKESC